MSGWHSQNQTQEGGLPNWHPYPPLTQLSVFRWHIRQMAPQERKSEKSRAFLRSVLVSDSPTVCHRVQLASGLGHGLRIQIH